jgi:putative DNA primase/helicase
MNNPIDQFKQAMLAAGLAPPDRIEPGRWHKFPGYQKSAKNRAAWCFMFDDMRGGVFGDFSSGMESTWQAGNAKPYTDVERLANRERITAMQRQRDNNLAQRQQLAAADALKRWTAATPCTQHDYLARKGIQAHGAKIEDEKLLIPMRDTAGTLHSLQTIAPDGTKMFLSGGRVKGCYFGIGKPEAVLIVCEGFATGASIHECTGHAVAIAFNAGNLETVAVALSSKYPTLKIIIAADDDHLTPGNPGMTKAKAAVEAVGGVLAVPVFKELAA